MSAFEYVSVMVTVVLALAVARLLTFLATVIASSERIRAYWLHLLWAVLLLVVNLQAWLILWSRHRQSMFPVGEIVMMVLAASLIFVAAHVLVPDISRDECVDLRAHYLRIKIPLFATLSAFWLFPLVGGLAFMGRGLFDASSVARSVMFGLSLSGLLVERLWWHAFLGILSGVLILGSLALLRDAVG